MMTGGLCGALGMLEEGAQTLSMPSALVHFIQVSGSSTDFSELRISREIAEIIYELVLWVC